MSYAMKRDIQSTLGGIFVIALVIFGVVCLAIFFDDSPRSTTCITTASGQTVCGDILR